MSCRPEIDPSKFLAGLYSASAREYAELWAPVLQPTGERLITAMTLGGATTVLDLGAGTGALLPALHAAAPRARVIAVDRGRNSDLPGTGIWTVELDLHGAGPDSKPGAAKRDTLMDTTDKLGSLLKAAGLTVSRVWMERPERRWTGAELLELGSRYGAPRRRLGTLDPVNRRKCLARVGAALAALPAEALVYRPEMLLAVAARA